jgi:hypothetical protein
MAQQHNFKSNFAVTYLCVSVSSGELENDAKEYVQSGVGGFSNPHRNWVHTVFAGWTPRVGNPLYLFTFPIVRESTRIPESSHHKMIWRAM